MPPREIYRLLLLSVLVGGCNPSSGGEATSTETSGSSGMETSTPTGGSAVCEDETSILQAFTDPASPSGFVRCGNGAVHRSEPVECETPITPTTCTDNAGGGSCNVDADCITSPFGSCQQDPQALGEPTCKCIYGCRTDTDCGSDEICRCAGDELGLFTQCIKADCTRDSDCGERLCVLSPIACEPGGYSVACQQDDDQCFGNDVCAPGGCTFSGKWLCNPLPCG
jgi:hypothetical protein